MMKKIHFLIGGSLLFQQTASQANKLKGYLLILDNPPKVKDRTGSRKKRGEKERAREGNPRPSQHSLC